MQGDAPPSPLRDQHDAFPHTLEHDRLGSPPPSPVSSRPPQVIAKEEGDLDDLPAYEMRGLVETADEDIVADPDRLDDEDDDDARGLFGDDDEDDDEDVTMSKPAPDEDDDEHLTAEEKAHRLALEYNEDPYAEALAGDGIEYSQSIAQIELANFGLPAHSKVWHVKLPSFLALNSVPFDVLMWEPEDGDAEGEQKNTVPDEYVIRWRWAKDAQGNPIKESNARFVRWTDGSVSLQIGSELFDVSASIDHSALLASSASSSHSVPSTAASSLSSYDAARGHGTSYLTVDHLYSGLLEAQASIHGSLSITPTNLQSATHRRLAGNIAKKYERRVATKHALSLDEDPERRKAEREKADQEKARKAKAKARRDKAPKRGVRRQTRFEEGEEEDDGEDDDDEGTYDRRSQPKRGAGGPLAKEDEYDEEDGFVVQSSDEDDANAEPDLYSEDEIDAIEEKAEREEKRRKEAAKLQKRDRSPAPAVAPRRRLVVDDDEDDE